MHMACTIYKHGFCFEYIYVEWIFNTKDLETVEQFLQFNRIRSNKDKIVRKGKLKQL